MTKQTSPSRQPRLRPTVEPLEDRTAPAVLSQLTDAVGGSGSYYTALSDDGTRIAFTSDRDLTGQNADGNREVFLFDTTSRLIRQVTRTTGADNYYAALSGDGRRVAFISRHDLTGKGADGNYEIFLFDTTTNVFTQVTNTPADRGNFSASLSRDGTRIAFVSSGNMTGENPDGNFEVFLFDTVSGTTRQVTRTTTGGAYSASVSGDGSRVAIISNSNITGQNSTGRQEAFLFETASGAFSQITTGGAFEASLSGNGNRVVINTSSNLTGQNADGTYEIFLFDIPTRTLSQVTRSPSGSSEDPAISGDGNRIAFISSADLTGTNPSGTYEVFLYDVRDRSLTQLTRGAPRGESDKVSLNADGTRIAFVSRANLTGGNADGNDELFLAEAPLPRRTAPVPRPLVASLKTVKQKKGRRRRLKIVVRFADTRQVRTEIDSPFNPPRYRNVAVRGIDTNGDGAVDAVQVTAETIGPLKTSFKKVIPL